MSRIIQPVSFFDGGPFIIDYRLHLTAYAPQFTCLVSKMIGPARSKSTSLFPVEQSQT